MKRKLLSLLLALPSLATYAQEALGDYKTNDTIAIGEINIGADRTNNAVQMRLTRCSSSATTTATSPRL